MNGIIIYYSKTGFTARYAKWLSARTGYSAIPLQQAGSLDLSTYDAVLFAAPLYAGRVKKLGWFQRQSIPDAKRTALVTGAAPAGSLSTQTALETNFPHAAYPVFYLPGGLCYEKMGAVDRCIMRVFHGMLQRKRGKTADEAEMAAQLGTSFDGSDPAHLEPVIHHLQTLEIRG